MLALTRKIGESILIGDHIKITPIRVSPRKGDKPGRVRLAIEAPRHIEVDREEIRAKKRNAPPAEEG